MCAWGGPLPSPLSLSLSLSLSFFLTIWRQPLGPSNLASFPTWPGETKTRETEVASDEAISSRREGARGELFQ